MKRLWSRLSVLLLFTMPLLLTGCGERYFVLNSAGPVARVERNLIYTSIALTLIVVIPVIVLMFYIIHRFRDKPGNDAPYEPQWSENKTLEIVWWGIPIVIIGILGTLTVRDTFRLVRPPANVTGKPLTVQVTSLNWKWLFQYPEQNIATVNYCAIPTNRPVRFILTSNAPMNSFWVPQLGGQEYTMPGMAMRLWLQADHPGKYFGSGANFSGRGYAHMKFNVVAKPEGGFQQWVNQVKSSAPALTVSGYHDLTKDSVMKETAYSSFPPGSFERIVRQEGGMYMKHKLTEATD
ncbi:cytochrome ubiquinol oxidase subunit II [Alicyclobacillus sp. SO9]|uniref:ubiquinol oxidase subunit II n=1 Tax=Alicyclobacillus sp. SO9 TaxID=2665646 RepID=UPI001E4D1C71|nr:cytochrome ubiquinol oxidase subunit II [Alicyclobacillus sp. SO9]